MRNGIIRKKMQKTVLKQGVQINPIPILPSEIPELPEEIETEVGAEEIL